ncbi:MAG: hypothetical protein ACFFFB_05570 [Candidatus Heimdallarchaeota archaeon]
MNRLTKFFYSFDILDENEEKFTDYMKNYGTPVMSKYCTNWELYKLKTTLRGENAPQYIGCFEIPDIEAFYIIDPPEEMTRTIEEASKVCSNVKEWIGEELASNIKK